MSFKYSHRKRVIPQTSTGWQDYMKSYMKDYRINQRKLAAMDHIGKLITQLGQITNLEKWGDKGVLNLLRLLNTHLNNDFDWEIEGHEKKHGEYRMVKPYFDSPPLKSEHLIPIVIAKLKQLNSSDFDEPKQAVLNCISRLHIKLDTILTLNDNHKEPDIYPKIMRPT